MELRNLIYIKKNKTLHFLHVLHVNILGAGLGHEQQFFLCELCAFAVRYKKTGDLEITRFVI